MKFILWKADNNYIMGEKIAEYKTSQRAIKRALKEFKECTFKDTENCIWIDDTKTLRPLGLIEKKHDNKTDTNTSSDSN